MVASTQYSKRLVGQMHIGHFGYEGDEGDLEEFLKVRWVERVQYRIVFEGIGTPLASLKTLYDFFRGLRDGNR